MYIEKNMKLRDLNVEKLTRTKNNTHMHRTVMIFAGQKRKLKNQTFLGKVITISLKCSFQWYGTKYSKLCGLGRAETNMLIKKLT